MKKTTVFHRIIAVVLCCCMMSGICSTGLFAAATSSQVGVYISKTYEYEKGSGSKVLTDAEAKTALTENTDLLILAAGRDVDHSNLSDDEFSTYLGYVNANLRGGNGSYKAMDFLRAALAVRAAGADPTQVGKDSNGNHVNLLYKGLYTRTISTLEKEGAKTVAYGLLALDANGISDAEVRSAGSKVSRSQLKSSLVASARSLSGQSSPDVGTSAMILAALAPYYQINEADVVSASQALLHKMADLQATNGLVKNSTAATAGLITALCSLGMDPAQNDYFAYDLHQGLMTCYNADSGFSSGSGSTSSVDATSAARCALVAYYCFDRGEDFYDFTHVKAHTVKSIASSSSNTNKNTSTSTNKNTSSSSSGKSNSGGSSTTGSGSKSTGSATTNSGTTSNGTKTTTDSSSATGSAIVPKEKFEAIQGKDEVYLYEGTWGEEEPYTLSFNGKDITEPMEFNAALNNICSHQLEVDAAADDNVEYITFMHNGAFPGKAAATITVSLADGTYNCYHYNDMTATFDELGSVSVVNSMASFDVSEGGEYFITGGSAEVSTEAIEMAVDDTIDGIVPASTFESIQGKNTDLILSGETDRGVRYEITFNGMDITAPSDFDMRIVESTDHWDDISKLAEGPLVLHFMHEGVLPGTAQVKFYANLDASVTYGLFYFNASEVNGVYTDAIEVGDGEFTFSISHCSEYFIAEYTGENLLTAPGHLWLVVLIVVGVLLLGGGVAVFVLYRRWGRDGFLQRLNDLKAKFGSRKKKTEAVEGETLLFEEENSISEDIAADDISEGEVMESVEAPAEKPIFSMESFARPSAVDDMSLTAKELTENVPDGAEALVDEPISSMESFARPSVLDEASLISENPVTEEGEPLETSSESEDAIVTEPVSERDYASFMRPTEDENK